MEVAVKPKGRKALTIFFVALTILSVILSACSSPATTEQVQTAIAQTESAQTQTSTPTVTPLPTEDGFATINAAITMTLGAMTQTPVPPSNTQTLVAQGVSGTLNAPSNTPTNTPANTPTTQPSQTSTPMPLPSFTSTSTLAPLPTNTAVTVIQPLAYGSVHDMKSHEFWMQFSQGFGDPSLHGALIDRTDVWYFNIVRDLDGNTTLTTGADQVNVILMGDYTSVDPTQGGKIVPFVVDGDTGVWQQLPNTTVTIPVANAYITLNDFTGETTPRPGTPALTRGYVSEPTHVLTNDKIEPTIAQYMGTEQLFSEVDKITNRYPTARVRNGYDSYVDAQAGKTLVWTKCNMVSLGWGKITESGGKCLYAAKVNGLLEVMYPFSGTKLQNAYPGYQSLPGVTGSAQQAELAQCVPNAKFAQIVNESRQTMDLVPRLALLPSTTHPEGTRNTFWNNVVFTSGDVGGTNLLGLDQFIYGTNGYRGLYFVTTDGVSTFVANSATITLCDGGFSPAIAFEDWWGK